MSSITRSSPGGSYFNRQLLPQAMELNPMLVGRWIGRLASHLGLAGPCHHEEFHELARGVFSLGGRRLRMGNSTIAWFDTVVAVSLSVSLISLFDERVLPWLTESVEECFGMIEQYALYRDQGAHAPKKTKRVPLLGLLAAIFPHLASRALEPNLHLHWLIFNLIFENGKGRALCAHELYRMQGLHDKAIMSQLAAKLVSAGYTLVPRPDDYGFEVAGIPEPLMRRFGTRRRQILARMDLSLDPTSQRRASNRAAIKTRASKKVNADSVVGELSRARLSAQEQAAVEQVVAAAKQRVSAGTVIVPVVRDVPAALAMASARVLQRTWVASDVAIFKAAVTEHWGAAVTMQDWLAALHATPLAHPGDRPHLYCSLAEHKALGELAARNLPWFTFRPENSFERQQLAHRFALLARPITVVAQEPASSPVWRLLTGIATSVLSFDAANPAATDLRGHVVCAEVTRASLLRPTELLALARQQPDLAALVLIHVGNKRSLHDDKTAAKLLRDATRPLPLARTAEIAAVPPLRHFDVLAEGKSAAQPSVTQFIQGAPEVWFRWLAHRVADEIEHSRMLCVSSALSGLKAMPLLKEIRRELVNRRLLALGSVAWSVLTPEPLADAARIDPVAYKPGTVLRFTQNTKGGFCRNSLFTVKHPHPESGGLIVIDESDRESVLSLEHASQGKIDVYVPKTIRLSAGDYVQLTERPTGRVSARLEVGHPYKISAVKPERLVLANSATIDRKFRHLDYGYLLGPMRVPRRRLGVGLVAIADQFHAAAVEDLTARIRGANTSGPVEVLTADASCCAASLGLRLTERGTVSLQDVLAPFEDVDLPLASLLPIKSPLTPPLPGHNAPPVNPPKGPESWAPSL